MSDVFFVKSGPREDMLKGLQRMYEKFSKDFNVKGKKVAVKVHFGERGNNTYLNPDFSRKICEIIRDSGGFPDLVESNCLYKGDRMKSDTHIKLAREHGFDFAPIVICDQGKDWVIPVKGNHFNEVKIGGLLKDYKLLINVTHCKGHIFARYGGALKNLGMGLGSRGGKLAMHAKIKPVFSRLKCKSCGICVDNCPVDAIKINGKYAVMDKEKCIGCATCIAVCPSDAVKIPWFNVRPNELQERFVEYACGILKKVKTLHFNFLLNITPMCDCMARAGRPVMKDIGILASDDVVSIEQASIDLIKKHGGMKVTKLRIAKSIQPKYAEKLGMGERKYNILEV